MEPPADDDRLITLAGAIADRTTVNWDEVPQPDTLAEMAVIQQLRLLDRLAAVHADRTAWGSLAIREPVGHGSFGTVYRAFDRDLERDVALKVTQPRGGKAFDPERLVREARLLARVRHPNVVTVFAAERHGDEVGVSMELLTGKTLHDLVRASGSFSAREALLMGLDVCRALAAVHAAGLLHGDIKAHNVMREEGGRIVLMDFGAGRDLQAAPHSDFAGTPLYIAPEVFAGQPRSRASDVYSVGVLLFFLATGSYPVEGDTRSQIDRGHQLPAGRRRLRDVRPDLPDAFIRTVERATAVAPTERYQSAGELETALMSALTERQTGTPPYVVWRRTLQTAAAALAIIALAGTAWWTFSGRPAPGVSAPADTPASAANAPAAPPAASAMPYEVEAGVYRVGQDGPLRLLPGARVTTGDELFLQIETSVSAHVYVVNEDDRGESFLLFPLPGQAARNPLPGGRVHRLPGRVGGTEMHWQVSSAGGQEHFLVFVSPDRLDTFESIFAALPPPTDQPVVAARMSREDVGQLQQLRGVGGIVPADPARSSELRLSAQYPTPLPTAAESVSGLWIRQAIFDNPDR